MQLCLQMELAEEKSQSLHSQKPPQWAEQVHFKKEKNRYFQWYKKLVYAGPKSARNIFTNFKPEKPGPTYNFVPQTEQAFKNQRRKQFENGLLQLLDAINSCRRCNEP